MSPRPPHVVAAPSLREGLGFIGIEAMAASCPLVATRNAGFAQYCVNESHALLTEPGTSRSWHTRSGAS